MNVPTPCTGIFGTDFFSEYTYTVTFSNRLRNTGVNWLPKILTCTAGDKRKENLNSLMNHQKDN